MSQKFSIDVQENIVSIQFSCDADASEILGAIDIVSKYYQARPRLWDFSDGIKLDSEQVRVIARQSKVRFLKPSKAAIVVPRSISLELTTIFEIFRADDFTENMIFRSRNEAVAW